MDKSNLIHFLDALNMNLTEFANEIGMDKKRLNDFERGQSIYDTAQIISEYFKENGNEKDIRIIKEFLRDKSKNISIDSDFKVYDELRNFLTYQLYCHYNIKADRESRIFKNKSYVSFYHTYTGKENTISGFKNFLSRAQALSPLEKSIIVYDKSMLDELNIYDDLMRPLLDISKTIPIEYIMSFNLPKNHIGTIVLYGITKNHLLFQIYTNNTVKAIQEVYSVLIFDYLKANKQYTLSLFHKENLAPVPLKKITANMTRLSYLLDILSVNSALLSKALFIDKTLISKWRTGKRNLKNFHSSVNKLINFICRINKDNKIIYALLKAYYPKEYRSDDYTIEFLLRSWVLYDDILINYALGEKAKEIIYSKAFTFIGVEGFIQAADSFFEYCRVLGGSHHIHTVCLDNIPLLFNLNPAIINNFGDFQYKNIFSYRSDFTVSRMIKYLLDSENGNCYGNTLFENILKNKIIPFVYYDYSYIEELKIIIVIKDLAALEVIQGINNQIITIVHLNKIMVESLYRFSLSIKQKAKKMTKELKDINIAVIQDNSKNMGNKEIFIVSGAGIKIPLKKYIHNHVKHIIIVNETVKNIPYYHASDDYQVLLVQKKDIKFSVNYILNYENLSLIIWDQSGHVNLIQDKCMINIFHGISLYQWNSITDALKK